MSETDLTTARHEPEQIRSWLVDRIAYYVMLPAQEIEPDVSLAEYGLDSVYAFALCGEIEDTLGIPIEPTLLWDVDTLATLTAHLAERVSR
jgi:acyl carrier protein